MYNSYEDFGELLEDESTDFTESVQGGSWDNYENAEARPQRRFGRVSTARSGNPVPRAAAGGYATKAELQATAQKLDARIATNSKAITTVDGRVRALHGDMGKLRSDFRREAADRKATTDALKKGLDDARQLMLLLPLLSTQSTATIDDGKGGKISVVTDDGDQLSRVLPILLLSGGLGGTGMGAPGSSSGGLFGGDNSIATLAIVMALTSGKN